MTELDELIVARANAQSQNYIPIINSTGITWNSSDKLGYLSPTKFRDYTGVPLHEHFYIRSVDTEKVTLWSRTIITPSMWTFKYGPRKYDDVDPNLTSWSIIVEWT